MQTLGASGIVVQLFGSSTFELLRIPRAGVIPPWKLQETAIRKAHIAPKLGAVTEWGKTWRGRAYTRPRQCGLLSRLVQCNRTASPTPALPYGQQDKTCKAALITGAIVVIEVGVVPFVVLEPAYQRCRAQLATPAAAPQARQRHQARQVRIVGLVVVGIDVVAFVIVA